MSIYSGFATRSQEQAYDYCVDSLLYVLQKRIIKFYSCEQAEEDKFITLVSKLHQQLKNMEKCKYLDPKASTAIGELVRFLAANEQDLLQQGKVPIKEHKPAVELLPVNQAQSSITSQKSIKPSALWVLRKSAQDENVPTEKKFVPQSTSAPQKPHTTKEEIAQGDQRCFCEQRNQFIPFGVTRAQSRAASRKHFCKPLCQRDHSLEMVGKPSCHQSKYLSYANESRARQSNKNRSLSTQVKAKININQGHTIACESQHNAVAGIIKDYIIKSRKSAFRGHRQLGKHELGEWPYK